MKTAIVGTDWTPLSKCDGFLLTRGDKQVKVKIPQSQTQVNVNPNNFEKMSLEVVGQKANIRLERYMDLMCQRAAAILFIQRFYRGHLVRKREFKERKLQVRANLFKNKAVRVITENLQLASDRARL